MELGSGWQQREKVRYKELGAKAVTAATAVEEEFKGAESLGTQNRERAYQI